MEEVISKVLLDHVTLISTAYDKVVDAEGAVDLENMPEDWQATHLHQWLRADNSFFSEASSPTASKNDSFQAIAK
jgi:hypothetical protein